MHGFRCLFFPRFFKIEKHKPTAQARGGWERDGTEKKRARLPKRRATNNVERKKKARRGQRKTIGKQKGWQEEKKKKRATMEKKGGRIGAHRKKKESARTQGIGRDTATGCAKNSAHGPGHVSRPCTRDLDRPHKDPLFLSEPSFSTKTEDDEPKGRDRDIATDVRTYKQNTKKRRPRTSVAACATEERHEHQVEPAYAGRDAPGMRACPH